MDSRFWNKAILLAAEKYTASGVRLSPDKDTMFDHRVPVTMFLELPISGWAILDSQDIK